MKKIGQIIIVGLLVLTIVGFVYNITVENSHKKYEKDIESKIVSYLEDKYGDGNYVIENLDNNPKCNLIFTDYCYSSYEYIVSTDYFDDTFNVRYDRYFSSDNFLEVLFKDEIGDDTLDIYLKKYVVQKMNDDLIAKKYDNKFSLDSAYITLQYENYKFYKKPTVDDLIENNYISSITLKISDYYTKDKLKEFESDVLDVFKTIRKDEHYKRFLGNTLYFQFKNKNPFYNSNNTYYETRGNIKYAGEKYLLYINSDPIEIEE